MQKFVDALQDGTIEDKLFTLMRWSKEEPYWYIVAGTNNTINGYYAIIGDYKLNYNTDLTETLNILIESGWKCEIFNGFFKDWGYVRDDE